MLTKNEFDLAKASGVDLKKNFMVIRDKETGEVLQVANNLVVQSGRIFTLKKLFSILNTNGATASNSSSLDNLHQRTVCCFGIGSGGTPQNDPFNPTAPTAKDVGLSTKIPFRTVDSSSGTQLTSEEQQKYIDENVSSTTKTYYKKTFESMELIHNADNDDVYVKLGLEVSDKDARNTIVSELALFSALKAGNNYSNFEIFSRITFQSEPLNTTTNKALLINYYIYC